MAEREGAPAVEALIRRMRPRRRIEGLCAVLLPYRDEAADLESFQRLVATTLDAGLTPAVNMDTGYGPLLGAKERLEVLRATRSVAGQRPFVAGAFIGDGPHDIVARYRAEVDVIRRHGGTPILFPSPGLKAMAPRDRVRAYRMIVQGNGPHIAFELGTMFAPFGYLFDDESFRELLGIEEICGLKHSSLQRELEWRRLASRDRERPGFRLYTGNDLAIDMVMYGSDYLLGLSAFHPAAFAARDRLWERGDGGFYALNDALQALGNFAFRAPVPAYKHNAAQFLHLRGLIPAPETHPRSPRRPDSDIEVLAGLLEGIERQLARQRPDEGSGANTQTG